MPMTEYDGNVEIITNIGTTPDERGLSTDEFKAKFDEGLKAFVTWFNDTHKTEFDVHLAEKASSSELGHIKIGSAGVVDVDGVYTPTGFKVGIFSRDTSLESGTQAVTGVGFKPRAVILFAATTAGPGEFSVGAGSALVNLVIANSHQAAANTYSASGGGSSITLIQAPGVMYSGKINSYDADGFTIGWTKEGAKVGTAYIDYIAFR